MHGKSFAGGFLTAMGLMLFIGWIVSATVISPYLYMYNQSYDSIQRLYNITHDPTVEAAVNAVADVGERVSSILNSSISNAIRLIPGLGDVLNTLQKAAYEAVKLKTTFMQLKSISESLIAIKPFAANWETIEAALAFFGIVFLASGIILAKRDKPKQA
ncbi:MAG: hypothetical protein QXL89_03685 [Nitrososphaeria archaeon]